MNSIHTQLPYDYYALKFCKPRGGVQQVGLITPRPFHRRMRPTNALPPQLSLLCRLFLCCFIDLKLANPQAHENLGEFLSGDRIENSPYQARFRTLSHTFEYKQLIWGSV